MKTVGCQRCGKFCKLDEVTAVGVGHPDKPTTQFWCMECYDTL